MKPLYKHASKIVNKYEIPILFFVFLGLTFFYIGLNTGFSGPAYLSDEIGYLTKAIYLGGHEVDAASSWHAGYALLISPLFAFLENTEQIWMGIIVLNSLLFSSSIIFTYFLTKISLGIKKIGVLLLASITAGLYPALAVMSGYAFSSSLTLFLFSLSLFLLVKSKLGLNKNLIAFTFITGLMYWVHPTAIAPIVVSLLMFVFLAVLKSNLRYLLLALPLVALPLIYQLVINPYLLSAMTPEGLSYSTHYEQSLPELQRLTEPGYLKRLGAMFLGQTSYVLIVTLGLFAGGFTAVADFIKGLIKHKAKKRYVLRSFKNNDATTVLLYVVPVVLLTALVGSAIFANLRGTLGVHYWIYGRYTEVMLVPVLVILLLKKLEHRTLVSAISILISGSLVLNYLMTDKTTNLEHTNLVNVQAFWPQSFIPETDVLLWFTVGIFATLLMFFIFKFSRPLAYVGLASIYMACINTQLSWHTEIVEGYSQPSEISNYINDNFQKDDCVGFDNTGARGEDKIERFELYSFYLFNFDFQRMNFEDWSSRCGGPYLTFDKNRAKSVVGSKDYEIVGVEIPTYLYVIGKTDLTADDGAKNYDESSGFFADNKISYTISADQMRDYTDVGRFDNGELRSDGKKGFLLYGPSIALQRGRYELKLNLSDFDNNDRVRVEAVTEKGNEKLLSRVVRPNEDSINLDISGQVLDLEIRLFVDEKATIGFREYTLKRRD